MSMFNPGMSPLTPEQWAVVDENRGLVGAALRRFGHRGEEDDAFGWGLLGLARAVQKYDASTGFAFSTYAMGWIRSAVQTGGSTIDDRHHQLRGGPRPRRAFSLDAPNDDGLTLGGAIAAPCDVASQASSAVLLGDVRLFLLSCCRDALDLAIVEDRVLTLEPVARTVVGAAQGVDGETVRRREKRLRHLVRAEFVDAA